MPCTYTFDGQTFQTKALLDAYIAANREAITAKYASNLQNQIVGAKGAQANRELSRSLNAARELESNGATKEEIFKQTGWERGADSKWRTKLPTDNIKIITDPIKLIQSRGKFGKARLREILDYPELYNLYPSLRGIEVDLMPASNKANGTILATGLGKLFLRINEKLADNPNKEKMQEVIIHEVQHLVQALEDFYFSPNYGETDPNSNEGLVKYFNSHSEIEARNAARLSFINDNEKEGLTIQRTEDIRQDKKTPSTPYSKDFTGTVVFNKDQDNSITLNKIQQKLNNITKGQVLKIIDSLEEQELQSAEEEGDRTAYNEDVMDDFENFRKVIIEGESVSNVLEDIKSVYPFGYFEALRNVGIVTTAEVEVLHSYDRANTLIGEDVFYPDMGMLYSGEKYLHKNILNQEAKGAFDTMQRVIYAVTDPNVSTPLHELAHAWEISLTDAERQQILDWAKHTEWSRETSEQFARGFEQYMLEGKSKDSQLQTLFDKFAAWLKDVYDKVVTGLGLQLNDQMVDIYDRMLGIKAEVANQKYALPTIEQILEQPNPRPGEPDFGRTSAVQNALAARYYDSKIADGTMEGANLRQVLTSNGLSERAAETVMFRVNNPAVIKLIDQTIPTDKYNKTYLQAAKKAYTEGTLDQAAINKVIKWDKYYQILDYIGETTPVTNEAKVDEFVRKFYMGAEVQPVEEPVVDKTITNVQPAPSNVAPIVQGLVDALNKGMLGIKTNILKGASGIYDKLKELNSPDVRFAKIMGIEIDKMIAANAPIEEINAKIAQSNVITINSKTLPSGLVFSNAGNITFNNLTELPENTTFTSQPIKINTGNIYTNRLKTSFTIKFKELIKLPASTKFENRGILQFDKLTHIPAGMVFNNRGSIKLKSVTTLGKNVEFNNKNSTVYFDKLKSFDTSLKLNTTSVQFSQLKTIPKDYTFIKSLEVVFRNKVEIPEKYVFSNRKVMFTGNKSIPSSIKFKGVKDLIFQNLTEFPNLISYNGVKNLSFINSSDNNMTIPSGWMFNNTGELILKIPTPIEGVHFYNNGDVRTYNTPFFTGNKFYNKGDVHLDIESIPDNTEFHNHGIYAYNAIRLGNNVVFNNTGAITMPAHITKNLKTNKVSKVSSSLYSNRKLKDSFNHTTALANVKVPGYTLGAKGNNWTVYIGDDSNILPSDLFEYFNYHKISINNPIGWIGGTIDKTTTSKYTFNTATIEELEKAKFTTDKVLDVLRESIAANPIDNMRLSTTIRIVGANARLTEKEQQQLKFLEDNAKIITKETPNSGTTLYVTEIQSDLIQNTYILSENYQQKWFLLKRYVHPTMRIAEHDAAVDKIVEDAKNNKRSIREEAISQGFISPEEFPINFQTIGKHGRGMKKDFLQYKSKIENLYDGWYYTFFGSALKEMSNKDIKYIRIPTSTYYTKQVPGAKNIAFLYDKIAANFKNTITKDGKWYEININDIYENVPDSVFQTADVVMKAAISAWVKTLKQEEAGLDSDRNLAFDYINDYLENLAEIKDYLKSTSGQKHLEEIKQWVENTYSSEMPSQDVEDTSTDGDILVDAEGNEVVDGIYEETEVDKLIKANLEEKKYIHSQLDTDYLLDELSAAMRSNNINKVNSIKQLLSEINNLTNKDVKFYYNELGEIEGFAYKNEIYLNEDKLSFDTIFEEAGHIWINWAEKTRPELYVEGISKVVGSKYVEDVLASEFYVREALKFGKEGSAGFNKYIYEEALSKAIRDNGAKLVNNAKKSAFTEWLNKLWKDIKALFGLHDLSIAEVRKLNLNEFAERVAANLMNPEANTKSTVKSQTARQTFDAEPYALDPNANINIQQNFNDITEYTVVDNNGKKLIARPFNSFAEAQEALEEINTFNGLQSQTTQIEEPTAQPIEEQPITTEIQTGDHIIYEGATYKELKGRPIEVTDTHETDANVTEGFVRVKYFEHEVPLFSVRKATAEEVQTIQQPLQEEKPLVTEDANKFAADDKVTFQGEEYTVNYSDIGLSLDNKGKEVRGTVYNISRGQKTITVPESAITAAKPSTQKQIIKNHVLTVISNRFQQLFPQIETEIDSFDFEAPARFYNGRVQLNTNYQGVGLFKEGIAHEYMHPVVAALKVSNKYLYDNLVAELKAAQKDILAEVQLKVDKGLYTETDMIDEALVTFLGREISKAFDEQGIPRDYNTEETLAARKELAQLDAKRKAGEQIDEEYYEATRKQAEQPSFIEGKRRTLIQRFLQWWTDVMDFILGKKLVRPLEKFIDSVNGKTKLFTFHARDNADYGIDFVKNGNKVDVYIDKTMFPDLTSIEVMRQYTPRMSQLFKDNTEFEQYEKEFNTLLDENRLTWDPKHSQVKGKQNLNITSLHPRMGLNGVVTLMQANLGKQAITPIQYSETELGVIQQLEAYLKLSDEQADILKNKRANIVKKIKALGDIATRRIGEGTKFIKLKEDAESLSKHNVFTENDAEFIADYIKHGADSINTAWRMFNNLREELKQKDTLDNVRLNRINKEIEQIKQLVGMYDDVRDLYRHYNESFEQDEISNFEQATIRLELIKSQMKGMMAELAVEQLMPTIERNNKSLEAQGYKKYVLSRKDVEKLLLNGSTKDIGWFAHMLGAPVNSTDTINAAVANSIADALNYVYSNNLEAINSIVDAYKNFDQRKLSQAQQEDYFKKNYLRKAQILDVISRDDTGKPTFGYIEKYAFHQDKFYDLFEKDLKTFKDGLPVAMTLLDDQRNQDRINAWKTANENSQKYVNPQFQKLKSDKYYQSLYTNYTTYNNKYGENRLAFGVIPQFFHESLMTKFKNKVNDFVKVGAKGAELKERFTQLGDAIFGEQLGDKDKRGKNLDGTIYRSVNSETTTFKDDSKLNYNLQEIMIDFISDAGNYEAKREVQFNMENIKQLIGGNSFFGIGERTIGTRDFATEFRQQRAAKEKLKKIEAEIKNGKVLNATEQAEYEKLKEQAAGNVFKQVYDQFLGRPIKARTARANTQAVEFINDVFYNEDEFESHVKIGGRTFDLNKTGAKLGFVQAIVNMSGNVVAATNNVLAGNMSMFIEASGGKHFTLKDLGLAHAQYAAATPGFFADMTNPIKSEVTQYGLLFDAIQGEFTNNLGEKISGNLMKRYVNPSSFFLLTHAGEHQIQLTGMLALMNATKLKTTTGETITLKQAFAKDQNGRYKLRPDVNWSKEDKQQFVRTLHGISRTLNGNYNNLHKGHIQRYWFGKLAMQYRKYIYPAVVARYGQERVDLEKGTVEMGYLRYFVGDFLFKNMVQLQFNMIKNYKDATPDQKYMARKAMTELSVYALLTIAAIAMGSGDPDKIKEMSQAEKALLFFTIRVHNELGMYHLDAVTEAFKQAQHPIASMRLISAVGKTLVQLRHPTETYEQDGNGYKAGDLKITAKFKKVIPKLFTYPADRFQINWDNYLSYQSLIQQMPR